MNPSENNWPFETWLRLGIRGFRLSPDDFWEMSLRDWLTLTRTDRTPCLSAQDLDALIIQFPDEVIYDSD